MFLTKILSITVCIFILQIPIFGQENSKLSEKEVRSSKKIQFQNRTSRKASEGSREKDIEVGKSLSINLEKKPDSKHSRNGVSVKRINATDDIQFGADIISLTEHSNFGHIHSIQRILSGYIQNTFEYKESDSDTIALYILYYNAMHRGNLSYIQKRYNKDVVGALDKNKIGISKTYREWKGKTQILIPVEKNILKDKKKDVTLDELEKEVNKVIEKKENGKEDKSKFDDVVKKKNTEEKKQIEKKKEEIRKKEEQIAKKETEINKRETELKKDPEKNKEEIKKEEAKKEEVKKEKDSVEKEKKEIEKKEEKIVKKEEKSEKKETTSEPSKSKKEDPTAEQTKKELEATKKELEKVKEEEKQKTEFDKNVVGGKILFLKTLKYLDQGHYNNEMHVLDPEKDDSIMKGEFNNICGRTFEIFSDKVLLIGFQDSHSKNHKLTFIDKDSLKLVKMSEVNVFWRTPMIIKGEELYAFEEENGKVYFAKFDKELKRVLRSDSEVGPNSNVTFYGSKIYITGKEDSSNTEIKIFKKDDLKLLKKIQP
ncbi:MAG: hypothetical protein L6Q54_03160 [Leptospiraceae bacterium]|nr:hypothetical protein [Leptospiraceae bacterium]NUM41330.1 hypothetical protein [Leptospiraceae bacterium]